MGELFDDRNLVFILSQPRAGSTLLQLMLGGHPEIATASESWIALHALYELKDKGLAAEYDARLARWALMHFLENCGTDLQDYKTEMSRRMLALYNRAASSQHKRYYLDKTPRYYFVAQELLELFPRAKFIVLFRNPLAVMDSMLDTWVKDDLLKVQEYRHDLMTAPYKLLAFCEAHPQACLKVKYEEIVSSPEASAQKLCAYLDIKAHEGMLSYNRDTVSGWHFGDKAGTLRWDRPSTDSISKWTVALSDPRKKYLFSSYIMSLGQETVTKMGYDYAPMLAETGPPGAHPGIPWHLLMRDNTSLYNSLELSYHMAAANGWPIRTILSAAVFGLDYMSRGEPCKGRSAFWWAFFKEYTRRLMRRL